MKSLIKKLSKIRFLKHIRRKINLKPVIVDTFDIDKNVSISDGFLWRTDNNYVTKFKYLNILKFFYGINNQNLRLIFYTKKNFKIKEININKSDLHGELLIDKKFMNGLEDYGYFCIFHKENSNQLNNVIISNKCYLGFSKNKNFFSFVHGNTLVKGEGIYESFKTSDYIKTSLLKSTKYKIQKNFETYDTNELFLMNPTTRKLKLKVNDFETNLDRFEVKNIVIRKTKIIEIISNCYFLRPTIFSYKNDNFDVHHG